MTEKIRAWASDGFFCVHVDDGVSNATVSLDAAELRVLYAEAHKSGLYAKAYSALARPAGALELVENEIGVGVGPRPAGDVEVGEREIEAAAKVIFTNIDDVAIEMMGSDQLKAFARVTAKEAIEAALASRSEAPSTQTETKG